MLQCPPGWHTWRAGDATVFAPNDPLRHIGLTYQERLAPLRSIKVTAREIIAKDPDFQLEEEFRIRRFLTQEGEYGACMSMSGRRGAASVAYVFASVFTEYFNTSLVALGDRDRYDEMMVMVLDLAHRDRLALGRRRRRVCFSPPRDWHPIAGLELDMVLLPPNYPQTHASIVVYPAVPIELALDPHRHQREHDERVGLPLAPVEKSQVVRTRQAKGGLVGQMWSSRRSLPNQQGEMVRYLVVMRDNHYVYSTKLETLVGPRLVELHDVFVDATATIEPIPQPNSEARTFEMWND